MDLAACAKHVFVAMGAQTRDGKPRLVERCAIPATARGVVNLVATNFGLFEVTREGLALREIGPGVTVDEVEGCDRMQPDHPHRGPARPHGEIARPFRQFRGVGAAHKPGNYDHWPIRRRAGPSFSVRQAIWSRRGGFTRSRSAALSVGGGTNSRGAAILVDRYKT